MSDTPAPDLPTPSQPDSNVPDYDAIDSVFRTADREIWIVTSGSSDRRGGLVATWVSQASLDRSKPVVMIGIAPNHYTSELIDESGAFGLHLITPDQIDLAWQFAIGSGRDRDKFTGLPAHTAETGSPLLNDCLAWLDCRTFARYDAGDRIFYWADVVSGRRELETPPLREQELFAAATAEQKAALLANLQQDIEIQRPLASYRREHTTVRKST